jgi:hypothetical protein
MTENKREKMAAIEALGFVRCGMRSWRDKHERTACKVCGYRTPFYRLDLATKHRERCTEAADAER